MEIKDKLSEGLLHKETWLASFPEKNPNPILEINFDGQIEYTNPAIRKFFPTLIDQQTSHPYLAGWEEIAALIRRQPDLVIDREVRVGEEYIHQSIYLVEEYQRLRVYGMVITQRKRLELEVQESEKKYRELVQYAPVGIYELDFRTQKFVSVNEAMCLYTGYSREELMAISPMELLDEPSQQLFRQRIQKWLTGEQPEKNVEYRVLGKGEREIWAELNVTFTKDTQGRPLGATVIAHDITERIQAEETQRESDRTLAEANRQKIDILESISDCFYALDKDLRFVYVNKAAEKIWGLSRADLLGRKIEQVFSYQIDISLSKFHQVLEEQTPQYYEIYSKVIQRWGNMSVFPTQDGISVYFQDTTERKKVEETLRQSEEKYRGLFNGMGSAVQLCELIFDASGRAVDNIILDVNPAYEKHAGLRREQVVGHRIKEILPDVEQAWLDRYGDLVKTGMPIHFEDYTDSLDKWYDVYANHIYGNRFFAVFNDITLRKKTEAALRESQQRYHDLVEGSNSIIMLANGELNITYMNDFGLNFFGYTAEELIGKNVIGTTIPKQDDSGRDLAVMVEDLVTNPGQYKTNIHQNMRKGGELVWVSWTNNVKYDRDGNVVEILAVGNDISPLIEAKEMLQRQQHILQGILDATKESIWLIDPEGIILAVNETGLSRFHYSQEEVIGKNFNLFISPELARERMEYIREVVETKQPVEFEDQRAGFFFHHNFYPVFDVDSNVTSVASFSRDITKRMQIEKALRDSEERERLRAAQLEAVLEALPVGVSIIDHRGGLIQSNNAFEQVWGGKVPKTQSVGDYQAFQAWWLETGKELQPEEWAAAQAVQEGKTIIGQLLKIRRFDGTYGYVINSAAPIMDAHKQLVGCAVAILDITRLHEAEQALLEANQLLEQRVRNRTAELEISLQNEKLLREQLIQAEKYAVVSRLLPSVAHEINNPLQTVLNSLYLLTGEIPEGESQDILKMAITESRRIGGLVQQIRETYQPSSKQWADFNVAEIIHNVFTLIEPQLKQNNVQWQTRTEMDPVICKGMPDQIRQVYLNICLNAIDAMGDKGGMLTVDITQPEREKVCIAFQDTGLGIPEEKLDQIFEPFYTTKTKGLGLGLSICREIIIRHGGEITVESQIGKGATFRVWLPIN